MKLVFNIVLKRICCTVVTLKVVSFLRVTLGSKEEAQKGEMSSLGRMHVNLKGAFETFLVLGQNAFLERTTII
jgi:hypothetical protein